ncbi:ribosomal protein S6 [Allomyces macrogynus ATCC 38327]|uniref:Ribosomal protein S6 n=1 Tax=Allomyces macrogynus (strain ATCC 38327) TaxID=578462 RepID=A0A0L0S6H4_ALLM3|nr:ribosomal protein S6 [Allomyces macrogynus ATCC 38327]|eukprot:KNE58030.1 ribosomal protein S6 [Allomyces macrogynus ATCC 38327]
MPLYELVAIARAGGETYVKPLVKQAALTIINRGGVVRSMNNLEARELPYRIKAHQEYHQQGHYVSIVFDSAPTEIPALQRQLRLDTRVLRATVVKLADQLDRGVSGLPEAYLDAMGFPKAHSQKARNVRLQAIPSTPAVLAAANEWQVEAGKVPLPPVTEKPQA